MGHKSVCYWKADVQVAGTCTLALMSCGDAADGVDISNAISGTAVTAQICFFPHEQ